MCLGPQGSLDARLSCRCGRLCDHPHVLRTCVAAFLVSVLKVALCIATCCGASFCSVARLCSSSTTDSNLRPFLHAYAACGEGKDSSGGRQRCIKGAGSLPGTWSQREWQHRLWQGADRPLLTPSDIGQLPIKCLSKGSGHLCGTGCMDICAGLDACIYAPKYNPAEAVMCSPSAEPATIGAELPVDDACVC